MFDRFIPVGNPPVSAFKECTSGVRRASLHTPECWGRLIPEFSPPPPPKQERAGRIASALDIREGNFKQAECNHPNWNPARTL